MLPTETIHSRTIYLNMYVETPTAISTKELLPLSEGGLLFLKEQVKIPYRNQNKEENQKAFWCLLRETHAKKDFISLLTFLYGAHFRGSHESLDLSINKLERLYPALMHECREKYFFPRGDPLPNILGVRTLVQKKQPFISSATKVLDEIELYEEIKSSILDRVSKKAFIVADYEVFPVHYYTVGLERVEDQIDLFLGESLSPNKYDHLATLQKIGHRLAAEIEDTILIYYYKYARQKDYHTCPYFAINDAVQFLRESHFFASLPKPILHHKIETIQAEEIPASLMKYTQFATASPYHSTYNSLSRAHPTTAPKIGRYLTETGTNEHSLIKQKRALIYLLIEFIQAHELSLINE